ncbi:hypothetical protein BDZ45DRAFT_701674 [Acephala macrosclerotiorum]|nr:hypothetical protein BDZ45DRAFT_701674 [Acephala macrosclerotiorum]
MPSAIQSSHTDRVFVASMHWNNELIIRSHWSTAVLDLVKHFGPENVYIFIIGDSFDDTKGALMDLALSLHQTTHQEEVDRILNLNEEGWIWTSRGKKELRRIPYLARIWNKVMENLNNLAEKKDGKGNRTFDKALWLNDVIFTTKDVTTLLATRDGNYAAACSLDFSKPPLNTTTPSESRHALMSNSLVPVKSCWNGIVAIQENHSTTSCYYDFEKWTGIWNNRWARWTGFPRRITEQYIVDKRIERWRNETQQRGKNHDHIRAQCIINEMQVLVQNGWAHV